MHTRQRHRHRQRLRQRQRPPSSSSNMVSGKIEYIIMLVQLFARKFGLSFLDAYRYISSHQGVEYTERHYDILHTLSFDDQVDGLAAICQRNGGTL